jgi:hypothetical protein
MSLIEENRQILADLEAEWHDLGPVRPVEFRGRFVDWGLGNPITPRSAAENFAIFAKEQGCECSIAMGEGTTWYVTATKKMEPTAPNITFLQESLKSFAEEYDGGFLEGWSYPRKKEVTFYPDCKRSNENAAEARAAVLFGSALVKDPLRRDRGLFGEPAPPLRSFKLVPSEFLRRARDRPPDDVQPTASAFSQWVYSLYGDAHGSDEDRDRGKEAEEDIWERRRAAKGCNDNNFLRTNASPWRLIHNGLHIYDNDSPNYFELSRLRVKGRPLRVNPDLVYLNSEISEVLIVEIKHSHLPVTKNLWPNVWAQLWCYSHIDAAVYAKKVTVVGEVWSDVWSRGSHGEKVICLRSAVRRNPRARAYDRFFRTLFQIYCGS